jgi:cell shape-determining protein MreC
MKKQYLHRRSSSVQRNSWLAIFAMTVLVVILFFILRILAPSVFVVVGAPLWKSGASLEGGVGNAFSGFDNLSKLSQQNSALQDQVTTLENENAALTARSQDLTKLLGGQQTANDGGGILAGVLAGPPVSPYDSLIVAGGTDEGVHAGAEVFAQGGIPIGVVKSTTAHTASIALISTTGVTTDGWVGDNRIALTLTGAGAGAFSATLPATATISVGDSVFVPGPGAIPIGTIAKIDADPSSPTVMLHIQPLVNIFSLTWVEIARS